HGDAWLIAMSAAAIGVFIYGLATRLWMLAVTGQAFSVLALLSFASQLANGHPHWSAALTPIAAFAGTHLLLAYLARKRWPEMPAGIDYLTFAQGYGLITAGMCAMWVIEYVPEPHVATVLGIECVALIACSRWRLGFLYEIAAVLCALGSFGIAIDHI